MKEIELESVDVSIIRLAEALKNFQQSKCAKKYECLRFKHPLPKKNKNLSAIFDLPANFSVSAPVSRCYTILVQLNDIVDI